MGAITQHNQFSLVPFDPEEVFDTDEVFDDTEIDTLHFKNFCFCVSLLSVTIGDPAYPPVRFKVQQTIDSVTTDIPGAYVDVDAETDKGIILEVGELGPFVESLNLAAVIHTETVGEGEGAVTTANEVIIKDVWIIRGGGQQFPRVQDDASVAGSVLVVQPGT